MTVADEVEAVHALIERVLSEFKEDQRYIDDLRLALHSSWADGLNDSSFVRLPILCCQAVDGEGCRAIAVAAAWHMFLQAARILDDLEDGDREGALWATLGPARAVNVATGLTLAAPLALARLRHWGVEESLVFEMLQDFQRTALHVCAGQHYDLAQDEISLEDYWEIVATKTGEPFALACRAGAAAGEGGTDKVALLGEFGYHLGMLNQICNDWYGFEDPSSRGDLAAGRKTLAVLYGLNVALPALRSDLQNLLRRATGDIEARQQARDKIVGSGSPLYLLIKAEFHRQQAKVALEGLGSSSPAVLKLFGLLERICFWKESRSTGQVEGPSILGLVDQSSKDN